MNLEYIRSKLSVFSRLSLQNKIVTSAFGITFIFMIILGIPLLLPGVVIKEKKVVQTLPGTPTPEAPSGAPRPSSTPAPFAKFRTQLFTVGTTETIPLASYTLITSDAGLQRMDDNGTIFYADNNIIYTYKLGSDLKTKLYTNTSADADISSLDVSTGKLFITKLSRNEDGTTVYTPDELDLASGTSKTLPSSPNTSFVRYRHLFKTYTGDIVLASYTQDCAEHGMIYRYSTELAELIKTGNGCSSDDRYLGYLDDGNVIMASVDEYNGELSYGDIFGFDVERLISTSYYSLENEKDIRMLLANSPLTQVAVITKTEIALIDLKTKGLSKRIQFDSQKYPELVMTDTRVIATDKTGTVIVGVDLKTGIAQNIQIKGVNPAGKIVYYLGSWKKLPVFYYTEPL